MKLSEARNDYYTHSGKLSDVVRQLDFAGIALIWMFTTKTDNGAIVVPAALHLPLGLFVLSLAADVMQYTCASLVWGWYHRHKEKTGLTGDDEFTAPKGMNWPAIFFFWSKTVLNLIGYGIVLLYMARLLI